MDVNCLSNFQANMVEDHSCSFSTMLLTAEFSLLPFFLSPTSRKGGEKNQASFLRNSLFHVGLLHVTFFEVTRH